MKPSNKSDLFTSREYSDATPSATPPVTPEPNEVGFIPLDDEDEDSGSAPHFPV